MRRFGTLFSYKSQKESLSEYGSGWEWESNTYAHVLDQTTSEDIPYRLSNNGTSFNTNKDFCKDEVEITDGEMLNSGNIYRHQTSCRPNTGNAGNYYSWPAATAGGYHTTDGYSEPNSICPTGWQLTVNTATNPRSWQYLIRTTYNIQDKNDSNLLPQPMSFIRSGFYDQGSPSNRANYGYYWSSTAKSSDSAYFLIFGSGSLGPQSQYTKYRGWSVRCVNR